MRVLATACAALAFLGTCGAIAMATGPEGPTSKRDFSTTGPAPPTAVLTLQQKIANFEALRHDANAGAAIAPVPAPTAASKGPSVITAQPLTGPALNEALARQSAKLGAVPTPAPAPRGAPAIAGVEGIQGQSGPGIPPMTRPVPGTPRLSEALAPAAQARLEQLLREKFGGGDREVAAAATPPLPAWTRGPKPPPLKTEASAPALTAEQSAKLARAAAADAARLRPAGSPGPAEPR